MGVVAVYQYIATVLPQGWIHICNTWLQTIGVTNSLLSFSDQSRNSHAALFKTIKTLSKWPKDLAFPEIPGNSVGKSTKLRHSLESSQVFSRVN